MSFHLSIVTPTGEMFSQDIESLRANGLEGQFGILGKHEPIIYALKKGPVYIKTTDGLQVFDVNEGVIEIDQKHNCLILAESAQQKDVNSESSSRRI